LPARPAVLSWCSADLSFRCAEHLVLFALSFEHSVSWLIG
jgi:hypothetical protein